MFILLVGLHDFKEIIDEFQREQLSRLTWFQFGILSKISDAEIGDINLAFSEHLKREQFKAELADGESEVLKLLLRYLIWIVVGWLFGSPLGLQVIRGTAWQLQSNLLGYSFGVSLLSNLMLVYWLLFLPK